MNEETGAVLCFALLAVTYAALAGVGLHRRGPGRWAIVAAGLCGAAGTVVGAAGTVVPIGDTADRLRGGDGILNAVPEDVAAALVVSSFSAFVAAQVLVCVGLLRAWRSREALPEREPV